MITDEAVRRIEAISLRVQQLASSLVPPYG
jgi:hypothetical protein